MTHTLVNGTNLLPRRQGCQDSRAPALERGQEGIDDFLPPEARTQFMRAVVPSESGTVPSKRKTGLKIRNVETAWLVKDERGWLQLVG